MDQDDMERELIEQKVNQGIMLETFKHIRSTLDDVKDTVDDIKTRLDGLIVEHNARTQNCALPSANNTFSDILKGFLNSTPGRWVIALVFLLFMGSMGFNFKQQMELFQQVKTLAAEVNNEENSNNR